MIKKMSLCLFMVSCASHNENRNPASQENNQGKLLLGDVCPAAKAYSRQNLLYVLNWNVLKEYRGDGKGRLPIIHQIISELDPDFIGLQEVYAKKNQESDPDIRNDFQIPLDRMGHRFWYSNDDQILVRSPDRENGANFSADTKNPIRPMKYSRVGGFEVRLNHPQVPRIRFINVHMSSELIGFEVLDEDKKKGKLNKDSWIRAQNNKGVTTRVETMRALTGAIRQLENGESRAIPTIVVGDFNSSSSSDWGKHNSYLTSLYPNLKNQKNFLWFESNEMNKAFEDVYRKLHPITEAQAFQWGDTWSPMWKDSVPRERLDYQYFRNPSRQAIEPICSQVIGETSEKGELYLREGVEWPSDHRALLSIYRLGNP